MTLEQARVIAASPTTHQRAELALALDLMRRELDRRDARELEDARLRAHAMRVQLRRPVA